MMVHIPFQPLRTLISQTARGSVQFPDSDGKLVPKKFTYHQGATDKSFENLSSKGISVPIEIRQLLRVSDGFEIYNFEGVDGYKIFSTSELPAINDLINHSYDDKLDRNFLIFAECIGDGSYLAVKSTGDSNEVLDCFLEVEPSEWKVVSPSVSAFFAQLIASNGQKFWFKEF